MGIDSTLTQTLDYQRGYTKNQSTINNITDLLEMINSDRKKRNKSAGYLFCDE